MAILIISLPAQALKSATQLDYVISRDGTALDTQSSAPWSLLPASARAAQASQVVLVLPVERVSWHRVQLPPGAARSARLRAVLEGLVEEQLLDDVADLHLALQSPLPTQGPVWLAACDKAWLLDCVREVEQAGLYISALVPELAPSALGAGGADTSAQLYALESPQGPQWVHSSAAGLTRWPLQAAVLAALKPPEDMPVWAEPAVAAQAEALLGRPLYLQSSAQRALLASQGPWDLAQFGIVASRGGRSLRRFAQGLQQFSSAPRWRSVRWGLWALLLVQVLGLNLHAYQQQAALNQERRAMQAAFTSTFPKVPVVVDAPVQMQREVEQLRQRSGQLAQEDAEVMLSALMQAANFPAAPIGVHYQSGALQLEGLQLSSTALADLTRAMQARGYQLQAQGATLTLRARGAP
jgi:general secretion pathway protein L